VVVRGEGGGKQSAKRVQAERAAEVFDGRAWLSRLVVKVHSFRDVNVAQKYCNVHPAPPKKKRKKGQQTVLYCRDAIHEESTMLCSQGQL
jgi:hypothetical protein